jgi:glyoxylase-like metal-dependent hydrolase (beta-lactamase superfamily II)
MQARVAGDVPLLQRVAWVDDAIGKLDEGVASDPILGRFARGLVLADLPPRFSKAQQAIADLQFALDHAEQLPTPLHRGIYRGLAAAYRTTGDAESSQRMLRLSGFSSLDETPRILGDLSVGPREGFRFSARKMAKEADGVYVAEGYDFANISFVVGTDFVVAIDAGTSERTARDALRDLRKITRAPIKYILLTHGHWDHAGGVAALREPGTVIIAQGMFPRVLARSRRLELPIHDFFGDDKPNLDVTPDRLVTANESIVEGGIDLTLIPAPRGETEDALFVLDNKHGILFVGDAFMPYLGAPFVAEGSAEGYRDAILLVLKLHPRRLVHGHPPLTDLFTIEAMPGLGDAVAALYDRTMAAANAARPLADVLHDGFLPPSLRTAPKAAAPFVVMRDTFIQRLYQEHVGYWQADGTGIDHFTRDEWGRSLDLLAGGSDGAFVRAASELLSRGDAAMALKLSNAGLTQHPTSDDLRAARDRSLAALRDRASGMNPFRFIVYSEWSRRALSPVSGPAASP